MLPIAEACGGSMTRSRWFMVPTRTGEQRVGQPRPGSASPRMAVGTASMRMIYRDITRASTPGSGGSFRGAVPAGSAPVDDLVEHLRVKRAHPVRVLLHVLA